jgi:hypothetical protein
MAILRRKTAQLLRTAQTAYGKYYNRKRQPHEFVEGDWVWLSTRNLRQMRPSSKLADKFIGPFRIIQVVGDHKLAYKLDLPKRYRIHNVFPITLLEPWKGREGAAPTQEEQVNVEPEDHYEVEAILDHRGPPDHRQFLIRWKGYSSEEDTWEPRTFIDDGPLIKDYEANMQRSGKRKATSGARGPAARPQRKRRARASRKIKKSNENPEGNQTPEPAMPAHRQR